MTHTADLWDNPLGTDGFEFVEYATHRPAVCCPNEACHARGRTGQGHIGIPSHTEQRFICQECGRTFSAITGTIVSRLPTSAERVVLVVTLLAHGCPCPAMVAACRLDERTVATWGARSGRQGQAVQEYLVEQSRDLGQRQADEIGVTKQGDIVWMALAMRVTMRLWLGGAVREPWDMPVIRRLSERVRRCAARRPLLFCTDGLCAYIRAMCETLRESVQTGQGGRPRLCPWRNVLIAPVVKRSERRRVVETDRRIVDGPPAHVETLRRRSQGDGVSNTASSERLNATCRERLAVLTRRGRALAHQTLPLHEGMSLMGTVSHFCPPHESLSRTRVTTPAMAAGITEHCWTMQELLSFHVPPPRWIPPTQRGRPSQALQRLVERWCA